MGGAYSFSLESNEKPEKVLGWNGACADWNEAHQVMVTMPGTFLRGQKPKSHQHQPITSAQSSLHPHRRAVSSSATEHQVTRGDPQLDWSALLFAKPASSSFSLLMPYCPSSWKNLASVVGTFKRFPKVNDLGLFEAFCRVNWKQFLPLWRCFRRPKTNIWDCWFMCAVDPPHWDWRNAQTPGDEWHLEWAANLFSFHGMLA